MHKTSVLAALAAFSAFVCAPAKANIITGPATVIDGDTIDMTGTRIRILGIDAPERGQSCSRGGQAWACGTEATTALGEIIANGHVTCTATGTDVYGRTLATCQNAVFDIGREMVRRGMAVPSSDAPEDYAAVSAIARQYAHGLWAGEFQHPADWRRANPRSAAPARVARAEPARVAPAASRSGAGREQRFTNALGCAIKGNHSRRGEWIYHLPGQKYYEATRPEALFCTESAALAAGYRRSKE
ncbi:MAG: thermonuclease family protein [Erythrobacter sp.]|jgi:endonuclease YncB( thermonuclease family)|uniref:thermonuclease family protein n=1 Tax=Erythrobacter sp. TaxID=1042 RepID=UPI002B465060|nr:thermonuclease family protein [Erythrobacter sp.]WRH71939.1 MAG: thermonuclease family protein [Erythrobacter sp.]